MMVHAGAGSTDDARNRGTLVNALLHHFEQLSSHGGALRPGIVHRLDKQTSGLLLVAKHDKAHAKLADMFSRRQVQKTYIALVHGAVAAESGTVNAAISPRYRPPHPHDDPPRRWPRRHQPLPRAAPHRIALRPLHPRLGAHRDRPHPPDPRPHGFARPSHRRRYPLRRAGSDPSRARDRPRSHAAPSPRAGATAQPTLQLERNFLHAAELAFAHPVTGRPLAFEAPLPEQLELFLKQFATELTSSSPPPGSRSRAARNAYNESSLHESSSSLCFQGHSGLRRFGFCHCVSGVLLAACFAARLRQSHCHAPAAQPRSRSRSRCPTRPASHARTGPTPAARCPARSGNAPRPLPATQPPAQAPASSGAGAGRTRR